MRDLVAIPLGQSGQPFRVEKIASVFMQTTGVGEPEQPKSKSVADNG